MSVDMIVDITVESRFIVNNSASNILSERRKDTKCFVICRPDCGLPFPRLHHLSHRPSRSTITHLCVHLRNSLLTYSTRSQTHHLDDVCLRALFCITALNKIHTRALRQSRHPSRPNCGQILCLAMLKCIRFTSLLWDGHGGKRVWPWP